MFDGETSSRNGVCHDKEELVDNLKIVSLSISFGCLILTVLSFPQLLKEHSEGILLTTLEDAYKVSLFLYLISFIIILGIYSDEV